MPNQHYADFTTHRTTLMAAYRVAQPIRSVRGLIRQLTKLTDAAVCSAWQACVAMHSDCESYIGQRVAIVAVGGYGRGDLLPNSDVDLLVLLDVADLSESQQALVNQVIESWLSTMWDAGLPPSHSVRSIDECLLMCQSDLSTQTAVLEGRWLTGSQALYNQFHQAFLAQLDVATFWRNKVSEMRVRYARFEDTPFSLEPNCKESPGGLRDLHTMLWLAKSVGLAQSWEDLQNAGWFNPAQAKLIRKCETLMLAIRAHVHILTRRGENRLLFDLQTQLAQSFGYADGEGKRASERLMQRYYVAASVNSVRLQLFLQKFEALMHERQTTSVQTKRVPAKRSPIEHPIAGFDDFVELNHELHIRDADVFAHKPHLLLELFYVFGMHGGLTGCSTQLWDAVLKYRERINPAFRADKANRQRFIQILQMPQGITHTMRLMHQMGILGRYLPVFRKINGQMQHDLFHIYTVDQHILMVVRNLRRFTMDEYMPQHELANQVMAEFGQPWLLYIAGLFHDIAKGRGGDHSQLGELEMRRFAKQHALSAEQTELVCFLVAGHLTMSHFAQKEDLSDPEVIERFVAIVRTPERLQALYLLTVADIRGTSPKVWNAWKDKLLADLYRASMHVLTGNGQHPRATVVKERQNAVRELLAERINLTDVESLFKQFNTEYFLRHDAPTIAWHVLSILQPALSALDGDNACAQGHTVVNAQQYVLNEVGNGLQLMVYTEDKPELFARICAFIQKRGYSIFDAFIYTSARGMALDTFQVTLPNQETLIDAAFLDEFNHALCVSLQEAQPLREPCLGRLSARSRNFPVKPSVVFKPLTEDEQMIKLTATDRPGVLYSIAYHLRQMDVRLRSARIVTLGERLEDVFVVQSAHLKTPSFVAELERRLLQVCSG